MAEHTPGPWFFYELPGDHLAVEIPDGRQRLGLQDARLISAAPELLAACEAVVFGCFGNGSHEDKVNARDLVLAAIARARGGSGLSDWVAVVEDPQGPEGGMHLRCESSGIRTVSVTGGRAVLLVSALRNAIEITTHDDVVRIHHEQGPEKLKATTCIRIRSEGEA